MIRFGRRARAATWAAAAAVSLALLAVVVHQLRGADWQQELREISWGWFGVGVGFFALESLCAALRLRLFAGRGAGLSSLRVTAWHGVWLLALPLRLGELAWLALMRRGFGWSLGSALACALLQRLLDLAAICAVLLLALPLALGWQAQTATGVMAAAALGAVAVIACAKPQVWLNAMAAGAVPAAKRWRWGLRVLRQANQARRWLATVRHRRALRRGIAPTAFAWCAMIAACWALCEAAGVRLSLAEAGAAVAGGSLATALPVQSVGGIGLLEATFMGMLAWFDAAPLARAAIAALAVRLGGAVATGLFWLAALAVSRMVRRPGG